LLADGLKRSATAAPGRLLPIGGVTDFKERRQEFEPSKIVARREQEFDGQFVAGATGTSLFGHYR
jgi:hypothetical protein